MFFWRRRAPEQVAAAAPQLITEGVLKLLHDADLTKTVLPRLTRIPGDPTDAEELADELRESTLQIIETIFRQQKPSSLTPRLLDAQLDMVRVLVVDWLHMSCAQLRLYDSVEFEIHH